MAIVTPHSFLVVSDNVSPTDLQVDLPFEQYLQLELQAGEDVFVTPRRIRVFAPEFEI